MVVVMVGDEFGPVNQPKRHAESGMARTRTDFCFRQLFEPQNQRATMIPESLQEVGDGRCRMVALLGPGVRRIGRSQDCRTVEELVETAHVELTEVAQVAEMFFHGPPA